MVKIGHAPFEERRFRNQSRPQLGIEVLTLAELRHRLTHEPLATVHRLDFHQITLITGGRGVAVIDFTEHDCRPGTLLHTRPGQVQRLPRADASAVPPEGVLILFTRTFVRRPGLLTGLGVDAWQLGRPARQRIRALVTELAIEYRQSGAHDDSPLLLRHLLAAVLIHIARLPRGAATDTDHEATGYSRFLDDLERRYTQTRQVRDYAASIGYSPRTLTRMSLAATGKTAKEVIDARVTLEAKRLLAHTERPVAAIAADLGFSEPTNFVKFFTARQGTTPAAFRDAERHAPGLIARPKSNKIDT